MSKNKQEKTAKNEAPKDVDVKVLDKRLRKIEEFLREKYHYKP